MDWCYINHVLDYITLFYMKGQEVQISSGVLRKFPWAGGGVGQRLNTEIAKITEVRPNIRTVGWNT